MTDNNVTPFLPPRAPDRPPRCEFPLCESDSTGFVSRFKKHLCTFHRKTLLLADSWLQQIAADKKEAEGNAGLVERLQQATHKVNVHFVIDRDLMNDLKGALSDQTLKIEQLEKELAEVRGG